MIVWQGQGYLVAVAVFGCSLAGNFISNATAGNAYWDSHQWPMATSLICSAAICWLLGSHLRRRSDRVVIDKETGQEFVVSQSRHTLFFIPVHYWPPILLLIAVILVGMDLVR
jgi:hypothetical protein